MAFAANQPRSDEYRYANSVLWGPTYNAETGMHHIYAESPEAAFHQANRYDKFQVGMGFLFRREGDGWRQLRAADLTSQPLIAALAA